MYVCLSVYNTILMYTEISDPIILLLTKSMNTNAVAPIEFVEKTFVLEIWSMFFRLFYAMKIS